MQSGIGVVFSFKKSQESSPSGKGTGGAVARAGCGGLRHSWHPPQRRHTTWGCEETLDKGWTLAADSHTRTTDSESLGWGQGLNIFKKLSLPFPSYLLSWSHLSQALRITSLCGPPSRRAKQLPSHGIAHPCRQTPWQSHPLTLSTGRVSTESPQS